MRSMSQLVLFGTLVLLLTHSAKAQDAFRDINWNHWAYQSVTNLTEKGVIEGYPDIIGDHMLRYKGNRPLNREEFAVAMERFLNYVTNQNQPRTLNLLNQLDREIAFVQAEADKQTAICKNSIIRVIEAYPSGFLVNPLEAISLEVMLWQSGASRYFEASPALELSKSEIISTAKQRK